MKSVDGGGGGNDDGLDCWVEGGGGGSSRKKRQEGKVERMVRRMRGKVGRERSPA